VVTPRGAREGVWGYPGGALGVPKKVGLFFKKKKKKKKKTLAV